MPLRRRQSRQVALISQTSNPSKNLSHTSRSINATGTITGEIAAYGFVDVDRLLEDAADAEAVTVVIQQLCVPKNAVGPLVSDTRYI